MRQWIKEIPDWLIYLVTSILAILLGIHIGRQDEKRDYVIPPRQIPPRPDTSAPMMFDHSTGKWIYVYRGDRAKGTENRGMTQEELQRYMEKKIPGYFEDTYWGEEYDLD